MGEDQWFQPTVRNRLSRAVVLANFIIQYGKFYNISEDPHRFHPPWWQISPLENPFNETSSAQGTKIPGKGQNEWGHCGRQNSPSGTEGSFEVRLADSNERIAEIYWDCPYIGSNQLVKKYVKPGYDVSFDHFSIPSGELGKGIINVRED